MSTVQNYISLLNTSSLTEVQYGKLYVTDQCCLIALINRIIFWFLGGMGYCLGQAVGSTTIQDEQAAIRNYSQAKEALRTTGADAVNTFATAYLTRKQQLQSRINPQVLDSALEADLQETGIREPLLSQVKQRITGSSITEQIEPLSSPRIHYEKVTGELMSAFASAGQKVEAMTAKIDEYVSALTNYAKAEGEGIPFIHQHMNVDLHQAFTTHKASIAHIHDHDYFEWCRLGVCWPTYRDLKWAIAEKLPLLEGTGVEKSGGKDTHFMSFFSVDLEAEFEDHAENFKFSSLFKREPFKALALIPDNLGAHYDKLYLAMKSRLEGGRGQSEPDDDVLGFKVKGLREVLKRIWQKHGKDYAAWINPNKKSRSLWSEKTPKQIEQLGYVLPLLEKDVTLLSEEESAAIDALLAEILKSGS